MEREFDGGLQKPELVAGIVSRPFETKPIDRPVPQQMLERVGELDLAATSWLDAFDRCEYFWCQDVAADDGEIRRGFRRLRLLHHVANPEQAVFAGIVRNRLRVHGAISGDRIPRDFHERD